MKKKKDSYEDDNIFFSSIIDENEYRNVNERREDNEPSDLYYS